MHLFFVVILAGYIGGNAYVFYKGMQALSAFPCGVRILFAVLFWLAAISFFAAMPDRDAGMPSCLSHALHEIGTGWLVFTLYMVMFLLFFDLLRLASVPFRPVFAASLMLTLVLLGYGYCNYRRIRVNTVDITLDRLPAADRPSLKIVAISDIHLGNGTGKAALREYVEMINGLAPDLILIGGDLIDSSVQPLYAEGMDRELACLQAPLGIYMVPGNHEYVSGIDRSARFLQGTSVCLLRDSVVTLPGGIQLIGRDDRVNPNRRSLQELMAGVDRNKPVILLDHQPYGLSETRKAGIDLQFSGHTHHGQVWPMNWITDCIFEQSHGYRRWGDSHIYVSSGLSLWGPPFRIGTQSEIVVLQLH